ncbi:MAG TPA: LPS export ABC transporter periplasmic protein LptC [Bryobacteraceae bacterium]|nr:LPS export ABC transporter periplasmic protein LptC [Bryobacteraceae bacterium]
MRHARPLFLLAFLAILAGLGATYYARLKQQALNTPAKPVPLPPGTLGQMHAWTYTHTSNQKTVVTVHADDLREVEGKQYLSGVVLDIQNKDGKEYNHVTSAKAEADLNSGMLYSEGEVEITMKVPLDQPPPAPGKLMAIKSSGVHVEIKTGKASTDRLATFKFDRGEGQAVGANYDPSTGELDMRSQVEMIWRGTNPKSVPMKIEAGQVSYNEKESKVMLSPWSRLTRDTLTLNAGPAVVTLDHGQIKKVDTEQAHGTDQRPNRNLEYAARYLTIDFNDDNQIQKITGVEQAKLVSTADTAVTTMTGDRVELTFDTSTVDSILQIAVARGHSTVESKPVNKPGADPADTRILQSDVIMTKMREGGQEIESVTTQSAGALEFIPNSPDKPHRWMNGENIAIAYGPKNQIQSFRATAASTRTVKPKPKDAKETPAPALTWSKDLFATFLPNSSQLDKLEQSNDFRYEAGDRKARADRAFLDQPNNRIDLIGKARIWDNTGSADADKILMNQNSGDFTAEGNVTSTRMPDKSKDKDPDTDKAKGKKADKGADKTKDKDADKKDSGGGMLAEDEPLHARAKKMVSTDNNLQIRYEGNAVLWQGANRLEGDVVEIDRDNGLLKGHGHVVSQLLDKAKDEDNSQEKDPKKPATTPAPRVFTIVKAPELSYDDNERIAEYTGGAILQRSNMDVKAKEIRAFLRNDSNDSSLDHAVANGQVHIHSPSPGRVRDGTSEHVEYFVDDDKVVLTEGRPKFVDSLRGTTEGEKLTWFSKDDRLLVNGVEAQPAKSVLHRKVK